MNILFDETLIKKTLKETSYDKTGDTFLVDDTREVSDFDEISKQIAAEIRLGNKPRSCDALFLSEKTNYLIEFKNKKVADLKKCKPELHEKAYDSLYQLQIYLGGKENIEELAKKTWFVLVYNNAKRTETPEGDISESKNIDKMVEKLKEFAKLPDLERLPKKFGLGCMQGQLYGRVLTMDVSDFNSSFKNSYLI